MKKTPFFEVPDGWNHPEADEVRTFFAKLEKVSRQSAITRFFELLDSETAKDCTDRLYHIGLEYFNQLPTEDKRKWLSDLFTSFHDEHGHYFDHYFRNMQHIFGYIRRTKESEEYGKIFQAQLSRHEIALLFYNCLSKYADPEFVSNIRQMDMLKGGSPSDLFFQPTEVELDTLVNPRYNAKKILFRHME
jgi:hypothetical protein